MPFNPVGDLAEHLETSGYGTRDASIFEGSVRPERKASPTVPRNAIFVSNPTEGEGATGVFGDPFKIRNPSLQIRIRNKSRSVGDLTATNMYNTLAGASIVGYLLITMQGSGPLFLGQNNKRAYEWSINITMMYVK